jgi:hypothetical protein
MELVERKVDVIVAVSAPAVKAARSATTTTPIVAFDLESDPMGSGLINSFSRPAGDGRIFRFPGIQQKVVGIAEGGDATAQQRRRFVGSCDRTDANERRRNCRRPTRRAAPRQRALISLRNEVVPWRVSASWKIILISQGVKRKRSQPATTSSRCREVHIFLRRGDEGSAQPFQHARTLHDVAIVPLAMASARWASPTPR